MKNNNNSLRKEILVTYSNVSLQPLTNHEMIHHKHRIHVARGAREHRVYLPAKSAEHELSHSIPRTWVHTLNWMKSIRGCLDSANARPANHGLAKKLVEVSAVPALPMIWRKTERKGLTSSGRANLSAPIETNAHRSVNANYLVGQV